MQFWKEEKKNKNRSRVVLWWRGDVKDRAG